jgi:hypothetical protein
MAQKNYHYRLKIVPRQRPNYDGEWIEVQTARPAPKNFLNASVFFAPFYPPSQFVVAIEAVKEGE